MMPFCFHAIIFLALDTLPTLLLTLPEAILTVRLSQSANRYAINSFIFPNGSDHELVASYLGLYFRGLSLTYQWCLASFHSQTANFAALNLAHSGAI